MIMEEPDEIEYEKHARAGLIPYMKNESGEYIYLMMVSSNSKFGGPRPMISKGKIEAGESTLQAAVREASEELGFRPDNMLAEPRLLASERVELRSGAYQLTVYGVPIRDRWAFDKWCSETEYTVWMDLDSFRVKGRKDHVKYVEILAAQLR